jgi:diaminohydroxyphosphoribosylaminopyrimidine deaminase/5-amino-6-(5-phosphoribosylamino)uracil reductase
MARKIPLRLLIDRNFRTPFNASIFSDDAETWCFYDRDIEIPEDFPKHAKAEALDFSENIIPEILTLLYRRGINSMIVEGGKYTLEMFIKSELWDEARLISGKIRFGDGIVAPSLKASIMKEERLLDDIITYYIR